MSIYSAGKRNPERLKPMILELISQMYRSAVDGGAKPEILSGPEGALFKGLLTIESEYELSRWLSRWFELFVSAELKTDGKHIPRTLAPALIYIRSNLDKPLTRDEVAKACNLSPSYFSRVCREATGETFSSLLNRFRVDHACTLFETTTKSASEVAFASGFNDHSYFTKVFKKHQGITPTRYRHRLYDQSNEEVA